MGACVKSYLDQLAEFMNFPAVIPETERQKALKLAKPLSLVKEQYFLKAGEVPQRIGLNRSGLLRVYYVDPDGKEINKHFVTANSLAISYSAFLMRQELFIQALEDTQMLTLDYEDYTTLLESHGCWQIAARKLAEMLFVLKEKRESELLLHNAQERYALFLNDYPDLVHKISQYHIASYLGITPESLSRIRSK